MSDMDENFDMPARHDPLEQCTPGERVSTREVPGDFRCLAVDSNGDYEILKRDPHPTLAAWLRFTIKKIG